MSPRDVRPCIHLRSQRGNLPMSHQVGHMTNLRAILLANPRCSLRCSHSLHLHLVLHFSHLAGHRVNHPSYLQHSLRCSLVGGHLCNRRVNLRCGRRNSRTQNRHLSHQDTRLSSQLASLQFRQVSHPDSLLHSPLKDRGVLRDFMLLMILG